MPYEFLVKNGLISQGNITATGSLTVTQNISASATGSFGIVGIGTNSPSAKLTIVDNTNGGTINLVGRTSDDTAVINFRANGDASTYAYVAPDTNEFRLYHNDGFMSFYPGGSEKVRITSTGNVGIGISNPSTKLHITGSASEEVLRIESQATGESYPQVYIEGNKSGAAPALATQIQLVANIDFRGRGITFSNRNDSARWFAGVPYEGASYQIGYDSSNGRPHYKISSSLYIQDTGNVGIGTYNPQFLLDVVSTTTTSRLRIGNAGSNNGAQLILAGSNTTKNWVIANQQNFSGTLEFTQTTATGSSTVSTTPSMVINSSGNVGIGTTSPSTPLHVFGTGPNIATFTRDLATDASFTIGADNNGTVLGTLGVHNIQIYTNTTEKVRINSDGNVGIGTSSPAQKLEVQSGSVLIRGDGNALFGTYYASAGENTFFTLHSGSGNTFHIGNDVAGTNYNTMVFTAATDTTGGNVGIGTTSPVAKLQVAGNISGSSFTSSISNAVGFLGTSSWAQNVISASYVLSSSFATTAQTANALNTGNSYTIAGLTNNGTLSQQGTLSMGSAYQLFATTGTAGAPGISFVGDSNTGIYSPGSDTIGFSISGSERMRIASDGNVGIGTTSPVDKLTIISGSTRIASTALAGALYFGSDTSFIYLQRDNNYDLSLVQNGDSNSALYLASAGNVYLNIDSNNNDTDKAFIVQNNALKAGTELFRVQENGSVGIGTSIPNNKLDVVGGTGTTIGLSNSDDVNRGGKLSIISGSATGRQFYVGTTSAIYNLVFGIDSIEKMRLDTSGYFAINTTNTQPYSGLFPGQLVVDTGTSAVDGIFSSTNQTNAAELILTKKNPTNNFGSLLIQHSGSLGDAITLNYNVNTSTGLGGTNSFKVTTDGNGYFRGNVGIGTTNPGAKLDLYNGSDLGSGANGIRVQRPGSYGQYGYLEYLVSSDATILGSVYTGGGASGFGRIFFRQHSSTTSRDAMVINTDGNVGIGTTSPATKLDVKGNVFVANAANGNNTIAFGNIGTLGPLNGAPDNLTGSAFLVVSSSTASGAPSHMKFYTTTGGTCGERMRIDSSGNVGIGVTNPAAKLSVTGSGTGQMLVGDAGFGVENYTGISVNGTLSTAAYNILSSPTDTNLYINRPSGNDIRFRENNQNQMVLLSGGNLGIGTTNPAFLLDVSGSSRFGFTSTNTHQFTGSVSLSGGLSLTNLTASNISASGTGSFGAVGIGTSAIDAKLTILGTSTQGTAYTAINLNNTDRGGATIGFKNFTDSAIGTLASISVISEDAGSGNYNDGVFTISTAADTTNSERFRITSRGNVGIGTTVPLATLDVRSQAMIGDASIGGVAYQTLSVGGHTRIHGTYRLQFGSANGGYASMGITGTATGTITFNTWDGSADRERLRIVNTDGNVGIGTTNPVQKLDVSGSIYINNNASYLYGKTTGGSATRMIGINAVNDFYIGSVDQAVSSIRINNNGSDRVIIDSSGNVGIGTTTVSRKLHVYVDTGPVMRLQSSGSNASIEFIPSSGHNRYNWLIGAQQNISDAFEITPSTATNGTTFSTPSLLIKSDGNVGIGSTSPAAKFVVFASAITTTSKDSYAVAIGNSNTDLTFGSDATYGYIQTWGSKPLYINNQGNNIIFGANVGIGTTNPASRLQIGNLTATQTSATETLSLGGTYSNTAGSNIKLKVYEDGGGGAIGGMSVSSGQMEVNTWTAGKIAFYRGTTQTAIIDASGQVGIGTTSPNSKLEVAGTAGTAIISVNNTTAGRSGSFGIDSSGVYIRNSNNGDYFDLENASGTSRFRLVYDNNTFLNTTYTSVGSLTSSGSKLSVFGNLSVGSTYGSTAAPSNGAIFQGGVGIGTTNPSYAFDVYTNAPADALMSLRTSGSANARIYFDASNGDLIGSDYCYLGQESGSLNFVINTSNVAGDIHLQPKFASATDGRLIVSGSSQFGRSSTSNHQFTGSVSVSNNVTCLSLTETSTEAVKYNIVPLPSQLENVLKLTPVSFNYKTNNKHSIGLIAEEVAKIYPEFTSENNDSISYGKMTSVLIQSIKELKSIIDTQQKQIEELLNKFKQL